MLPYLLSLFFSCFLLKLSESQRSVLKFLLEIVGILPIAILAGCRDFTIGTDTAGYPTEMFYLCRSCDSLAQALVLIAGEVEPLYVVLQFYVSRFFKDAHWILFFSHVIMYYNIVCVCRKMRIRPSVCVFIYFCVFFDFSLNGARQSIALSFIPLSFFYLIKKRYVKCIVFFIVAFLFHSSTLLCLGIFALYWLTSKKPYLFSRKKQKIVAIVLVSVLLLNFSNIVIYMGQLGFLRNEYIDRYANGDMYGTNFPISNVYINIVNLILYYKLGGNSKENSLSIFMEYVVILSLILCLSAMISTYAVRITFNFVIIAICYESSLLAKSKYNLKQIGAFSYFFYWFFITILNLEDVMPYTSKILGI